MSLQHHKFAMMLDLTINPEVIEQHVALSLTKLSESLTDSISVYAKQHKLGYYPAIDYFQLQGGIDSDLIKTMESVSWVVSSLVRTEVRQCLRPVFSSIKIESIQPQAYMMPKIKMRDDQVFSRLVSHFMLNRIKVSLAATLIQKITDEEKVLTMVDGIAYRRLSEEFQTVNISDVRLTG